MDYSRVSGSEVVLGGRRFTKVGRPPVRKYVPPFRKDPSSPIVYEVKEAHPLNDTTLVEATESVGASMLVLQARHMLAEIYSDMRACNVLPGLGVLMYGRCFSRQPTLPVGANPTFDRSPVFAVIAIDAVREGGAIAPDLRSRFEMPDDIETYAPGIVSVVRTFEVDGLDNFTIPPCRDTFDILTGIEIRGESVESVQVFLAAEIAPPPEFGGGKMWVEVEVPVSERTSEAGCSFTAELNLPSIAYAWQNEHLPRVRVVYREGAEEKCTLLLAGVFCSDGGHGIPALDLALKKRDELRVGTPIQVEELGAG